MTSSHTACGCAVAMSIADAAAQIGDRGALVQAIDAGQLAVVRLGSRVIVRAAELDRWLSTRQQAEF